MAEFKEGLPGKTTARKKAGAGARGAVAARKKAAAAHAAVANAAIEPGALFDSIFAQATRKGASVGVRGIISTEESERLIIGIPLPSLALRVLFQQDVLTLSRSLMIIGKPGSCKSAFLFELFRWVIANSGLAVHVENENKDGPDLRNTLLENDPKQMKRCAYTPSNSQEEWMAAFNVWHQVLEENYAKVKEVGVIKPKAKFGERAEEFKQRTKPKVFADKPGWIHPLIIGVDSLTATSSQGEQDKMSASGIAERSWSWEAQALSKFARSLPARLRGRPLIFAATNHLKDGAEQNGMVKDVVPGGLSMRFMDTLEIKLVKVGGKARSDQGYNTIAISLPKNSLGETGGAIQATMKWWWDADDDGEVTQRIAWDWGAATVDVILAQKRISAKRWKEVAAIVDLHDLPGNKVWSRELGIAQDRPVYKSQAGALIEGRPDLLDALYRVLHVKKRNHFQPGVPYEDAQEHLRRTLAATATPYAVRDFTEVAFIDETMALDAEKKRKKEARKKAAREDDDG